MYWRSLALNIAVATLCQCRPRRTPIRANFGTQRKLPPRISDVPSWVALSAIAIAAIAASFSCCQLLLSSRVFAARGSVAVVVVGSPLRERPRLRRFRHRRASRPSERGDGAAAAGGGGEGDVPEDVLDGRVVRLLDRRRRAVAAPFVLVPLLAPRVWARLLYGA